MNHKPRFICVIVVTWCLIVCLCPFRAGAQTVWREGVITRGYWAERYGHIEVNGDKYSLMPKVVITLLTKTSTGIYQEKLGSVKDLLRGRHVSIRVQGRRIYEIVIQQ